LVSIKNRLYCLSKQPNAHANVKDDYKKYVNAIKAKKRSLMSAYYSKLFQNCNSREIWSNVNSVLGKKNKNEPCKINSVTLNGKIITDNSEVANGLNNYFVHVAKNLAESIPCTPWIPPEMSIVHSMYLEPANASEISDIINKLKNTGNSSGDLISCKVLKNCNIEISPLLADVVNCSLASGEVPDDLKVA